MSEPALVTALLRAWRGGDAAPLVALMPLVEAEQRRFARANMARERIENRAHQLGLRKEMDGNQA